MKQNIQEDPKSSSKRRTLQQKASRLTLDRGAKNVSVDLTPHQKHKLRELADRSDMKLSEYLRAVINEALSQEPQFAIEYRKISIPA